MPILKINIVLLALSLPLEAFASPGGSDSGLGLVSTIGVAIVTASIITVIFNRLKLPALLAYIVAGLVIGAFATDIFGESLLMLEEISHIGLVFLLFIIGMEIDPTILKLLGHRTVIALILQAPVTIFIVYSIQWSFSQSGVAIPGLGQNSDAWFYYAAAASFGSTAVVIKLLGDNFDLGSQAGKITVMTLIAEDVWAITAISYAQSQGGSNDANAWMMIGGGILLTAAAFLLAKYVLVAVFRQLERSPDLLLLIALGWCFLWAESYSVIGLSSEVGALVAGLTVGRLSQHVEIFSKTVSLRDFFMALFFVALGVSLPPPSLEVILPAIILVGIVIAVRILLYTPMLLSSKQNPIVSIATSVNLSQLSVFTLILLPIGVANGALEYKDQVIISYALLISIVITAFAIPNNYRIALLLSKLFGLKVTSRKSQDQKDEYGADILMLGFFLNGPAIARHLRNTNPELLERILIIDTNTSNPVLKKFPELKVKYGDFSQPDTLRHYGIAEAKVVISTIGNYFLHGIRNETLVTEIKKLNPNARVITTCLNEDHIGNHIALGAFASISTPDESASGYTNAIIDALAECKAEAEAKQIS